MTPEGKELSKVTKWLKARRISGQLTYLRLALQPGVQSGWPDLVVLIKGGATLWIEMKAPGKIPAPLQVERINELCGLGYLAGWFDSADAAIAAITSALEAAAVYDTRSKLSSLPSQRGAAPGTGGAEN